MSSCRAASYSSGPLVTGQTRISRSFGSTVSAGLSEVVIDCVLSQTSWMPKFPNEERLAGSLQRCLSVRLGLRKTDLGHGHQNFRARLEVRGFQHRLLFGGVV